MHVQFSFIYTLLVVLTLYIISWVFCTYFILGISSYFSFCFLSYYFTTVYQLYPAQDYLALGERH